MVILGVMADTDLLVRKGARRTDATFFYIVPLSGMMIFARVIFFAFRARTNPPAHKHLILVATMALVVAAIARWPFPIVHSVSAAYGFSYIFLILLVAYDLWSTRKIHALLYGRAPSSS